MVAVSISNIRNYVETHAKIQTKFLNLILDGLAPFAMTANSCHASSTVLTTSKMLNSSLTKGRTLLLQRLPTLLCWLSLIKALQKHKNAFVNRWQKKLRTKYRFKREWSALYIHQRVRCTPGIITTIIRPYWIQKAEINSTRYGKRNVDKKPQQQQKPKKRVINLQNKLLPS